MRSQPLSLYSIPCCGVYLPFSLVGHYKKWKYVNISVYGGLGVRIMDTILPQGRVPSSLQGDVYFLLFFYFLQWGYIEWGSTWWAWKILLVLVDYSFHGLIISLCCVPITSHPHESLYIMSTISSLLEECNLKVFRGKCLKTLGDLASWYSRGDSYTNHA